MLESVRLGEKRVEMFTAGVNIRVPAVDRAALLLELVASSSAGLTLSEISRAANIPKSSAHYLVYTLLARGFLRRNLDGRTYSLGLRLTSLAGACDAERQVQAASRSDVQELAQNAGMAAVASVLSGAEVRFVEVANPPGDESGGQWRGRHLDLHCTSQGKAHLAYLPDEQLDLLLRGRPLARFTPKTICSLHALKLHLAVVRSQGFAFNDEEHIIGVRGIAAPVFDHIGHTIAAVGVTGSTAELTQDRIPKIVQLVLSASRAISRRFLEALPAS